MKTKKVSHKSKNKVELVRFIQYMVGGGAWFWSGYILIVLLDDVVGLFWANLIGNAVGITLNFLLQHYWAFKSSNPDKLKTATTRYIVYTVLNAFLLNYFILKILKDNGVGVEIGQFISAGFFTFWNYFWYKAYVFKDSSTKEVKKHG